MSRAKHAISPAWTSITTLQQLIRSSPVAVVAVDQMGAIVFANAKLDELFGYAEDELIGQPIEVLLPDSLRSLHQQHRATFNQLPHNRAMGLGLDLVGLRKDSTQFPIEVGLSHLHEQEQLFVLASVVDITYRKQVEETLERKVQERTRDLERRQQIAEGLSIVLALINAERPLQEVLDSILTQAVDLLGFDGGTVLQWQETEGAVEILAFKGVDNRSSMMRGTHFNPREINRFRDLLVQQSVTQFVDMADIPMTGMPSWQAYRDQLLAQGFRRALLAPILVKGEAYGVLTLLHKQVQPFSEEELAYALILSKQAALAIENARLKTELAEKAVHAERSRIARDLHDSVTQTIFSATMIADVLPRIWNRKPEDGQRRLDELRDLMRGALAEMRTLLLELRPEALASTPFHELFKQLVAGFSVRTRIPVQLQLPEQCDLAVDVRIALYRITQEALNNVAKHAEATQAVIRFQCQEGEIDLSIQDNGRGFDLETITGNHLGIKIMRERAQSIQADWAIQSKRGEGTIVQVNWKEST